MQYPSFFFCNGKKILSLYQIAKSFIISNENFHYLFASIIRFPKDKSDWDFSAQHLEVFNIDILVFTMLRHNEFLRQMYWGA